MSALGHAIDVVARVDQQQVDGADEAARANRGPQREHGPTDEVAAFLGHENACLRQIDQLAQQIGRSAKGPAPPDRCTASRESATSRSTSVIRAART